VTGGRRFYKTVAASFLLEYKIKVLTAFFSKISEKNIPFLLRFFLAQA
jgi:hypothetical protein